MDAESVVCDSMGQSFFAALCICRGIRAKTLEGEDAILKADVHKEGKGCNLDADM